MTDTPRLIPSPDPGFMAHLHKQAVLLGVPPNLRDGLVAFIGTRRLPGGFLTAVLKNDLRDACARADETSRRALYEIIRFLNAAAPADSWGSVDAVTAWVTSDDPVPAIYDGAPGGVV